jgi:phosphatidylglycerophosphatase A
MFAMLGWTEIGWISLTVLGLFMAQGKGPELWRGIRDGVREFKRASRNVRREMKEETWAATQENQTDLVSEALTPDNQTVEFLQPQEEHDWMKHMIVFLAQGFGIGRIPFAPGTWGSLLGVVWSVLLFALCPLAIVALAVLLSVLLAVWICGAAERILGEKDPGCIVLDEIVAMPLVYASFPIYSMWLSVAWDGKEWQKLLFETPPTPLLTGPLGVWPVVLAGFLLFRLFDIWKPWPVRPLQNFPGGWGVVVDDLAAALLANVALFLGTSAVSHLLR